MAPSTREANLPCSKLIALFPSTLEGTVIFILAKNWLYIFFPVRPQTAPLLENYRAFNPNDMELIP